MPSERWLLLAALSCGCMYDWDALRYDPDAARAPDRPAPDAAADARTDRAGPDVRDAAPADVAADLTVDAPRDAGPDAPDVPRDVGLDAAPDVPRDAAPDAAPDAVTDAAPDAAPDATPDVAPDLPPVCTPAGMMCPCAASNPGGYCRPGEACTGGRCVAGTLAGSLVITEIMNDPLVDDAVGEWFEVYNPGATPLDLRGMRISSTNDMPATVTPPAGAPLIVPARGYLVFGRSDALGMNGQVPVQYAYGSIIAFNNGGADSVILDLGSAMTEIDRVAFDSSTGGGWPRMASRSKSLRPDRTSATENDDRTNWCDATTQWFAGMVAFGSPGAANPACP